MSLVSNTVMSFVLPSFLCTQLQHGNLSERHDNEIAQEIQEELVRQAEQQRQQEEKDAVRVRYVCQFKDNAAYVYPSVICSIDALPVIGGTFRFYYHTFASLPLFLKE